MKILWLYSSKGKPIDTNHWFHMDFVRILMEEKNIDLMPYGFQLKKYYPDIVPKAYHSKITLKDIKKEFDFDVIIMDCKGRMHSPYKPFLGKSWLPKDFNEFKNVPKILIEGDYFKKVNWYSKVGIDSFIFRHKSEFVKGSKNFPSKKCFWLPCSVDIKVFKPNYSIKKQRLIFYCGTVSKGYYPYRYKVIEILKKQNLIKDKRVYGQEYLKNLQSYVSHLSGSSIYHIDPAKNFEIMASGSVLFTNRDNRSGITELFPNDSYCSYKTDFSDVKERANKIIIDSEYRQFIIQNALKCIREKHTHQIRAKELINIIKQIIKK